MIASYHAHTYRCRHASGSEEEYIQTAIRQGFEIFGFSDHAPIKFPGDYVSACRMGMDEIDGYFDTLLNLREKYKDYIQIPIGFEIEYYPKFWDATLEKYAEYPLDYLILGEHFIGNESISAINSFAPTNDENVLKMFVDYCISAIHTGKITYICHPDNIYFTGSDEVYVREMSRLINECNSHSVPLEINLYGIRDGRHYPRDLFWKTASKLGAKAIIGCDSHKPTHILRSEIDTGRAYAERFGLTLLETVPLIDPLSDINRKGK